MNKNDLKELIRPCKYCGYYFKFLAAGRPRKYCSRICHNKDLAKKRLIKKTK